VGRRVILLVTALLIAAVGTLLVYGYVQRADDRALATQKPVQVLVAAKTVPANTKAGDALTAGMIVPRAIPASALVRGSLSRVDDIKDRVTRTTIPAGQQIFAQLFSETASAPVPFDLPKDNVAVAFQFADPAQVAGFVQPGSRVTVFVTTDVQGTKRTRLLLDSVQVVAVGGTTTDDAARRQVSGNDEGGGQKHALLTLALTQRQAEQMIFADSEGDLYLGLLPEGGKGSRADEGVDGKSLFKQ
jgi:pilus assembly protein CpaB